MRRCVSERVSETVKDNVAIDLSFEFVVIFLCVAIGVYAPIRSRR